MSQVKLLFGNYILIAPVVAWISAQIFKIFTGMFKDRKFDIFHLLFSNGGMPSSHTSAVCALAVASIIKYGVGSFECAMSSVFAVIVMIDACGVRYETGEQAKLINRITKELFSGKNEEINKGLKELIGHTPFQVFMGALLGIAVAILMYFVMR